MIISHRLKFAFFRVPKTGSHTASLMLRLSGAFDKDDITTEVAGLPSTMPQGVFDFFEKRVRNTIIADWERIGRKVDASSQETLDIYTDASTNTVLVHMTPKEAIEQGLITLEQLQEYNCFAFYRNPLERHISAYGHMQGMGIVMPHIFQGMVADKLEMGLLTRKQTDYFYVDGVRVLQPLNFRKYDDEIKNMISVAGGYKFEQIPKLNVSVSRVPGTTLDDYYTPELKQRVEEHYEADIKLYNALKQSAV